ncbi:CAP domain-containing protein [Neobacillus massiliamazoniensis]|jgi:uncharacterized YkwD family protein|uniref:Allergen V5/Tpx-1 related n=1 Tax=Neobacillus massiliamazoniensis TaxID=1499688 RepID=A0A0U1NTG2_9BACI|nr:CAP domain-containing protein [Neobacillus massiliamazoniensis]CRK81028.1 Allergen V5/Tpx-1 related [Neobacillus massiliamazoniensis]
MGFKLSKIAVASVMLASLTACTANRGANINNTTTGPRNVSTGDLRTMNNRNSVMNDLNQNYNPANNLGRTDNHKMPTDGFNTRNVIYPDGMSNATTEIQPMNNGFITIAPNSYSTQTPSSQYPHTQRINQGNFWYYSFVPGNANPNAALPKQSVTPPQTTAPTAPTAPRTTTPAAPAPQKPTAQAPTGISQMAQQVINLTNAERKKNGLPPLTADSSLSRVAQTKTNDMEAKHYFSHTSPTYGSPFDMMRDFGISYSSAGENIAMGQTTAQQVVTAWMNSEGHRKNILSPNYTNIGVGFTSDGNYWSQMFIGK